MFFSDAFGDEIRSVTCHAHAAAFALRATARQESLRSTACALRRGEQ